MAGKLFDRLEREAFRGGIQARTAESMKWFRTRVSQIKRVSGKQVHSEQRQKSRHLFGEMYMMFYDPKHKKTLPYYDRFPLVIPFQKAKNGFLGLNLHYLPHSLRAKFLDELYDTVNNDKFDATTRFKITYDILQRVSQNNAFLPCVKHYLSGHIRSKLAVVDSADWEIAIFLPTEQFKKASLSSVYRDSRRIMRQANN
jgi:hypothetical protein|tara:strand:- start:1676 stop:2272 length:597 start_codon:yes stop_codon:yes gene_type:complete